jgi:transposase-like protein
MPRQGKARIFSREFKEAAVQRIIAGEKVRAVATELELWPKLLYDWWARYDRGGAEALMPPGRPAGRSGPAQGPRTGRSKRASVPPEAARIGELERKVGQQAVELDFFERALRHIEASRPAKGGPGARASSPSSTR